MSLFGTDQEARRAQTTFLRIARVVLPPVVLIATLIVGMKAGTFRYSALAGVDSPLDATILLGLSLFPGGTFFILRGLVAAARRRESAFWPAVKGFILPKSAASFIEVVRYGFNGQGLETSFASFTWSAGDDVEVRVDPEDPEIAVVASGDHTVQLNVGFGLWAIATAPAAGWFFTRFLG